MLRVVVECKPYNKSANPCEFVQCSPTVRNGARTDFGNLRSTVPGKRWLSHKEISIHLYNTRNFSFSSLLMSYLFSLNIYPYHLPQPPWSSLSHGFFSVRGPPSSRSRHGGYQLHLHGFLCWWSHPWPCKWQCRSRTSLRRGSRVY